MIKKNEITRQKLFDGDEEKCLKIDKYGNKLPVHTKGGRNQIYIPKSQF